MPNKKYLITGASGFIGSHLVEHLLEDGVDVKNIRLLVLPNDTFENLPERKFELVRGDIRDKNVVDKACGDVETIYHLASQNGYDGGDYKYFADVNVTGTRNILKSAVKSKVEKIIYFSSTAVYGLPATAGNIKNYNETHAFSYSEGYGQSKYIAEKLVKKICVKAKIKYIILRPATVYGPRDSAGIYQLIRQINKGWFAIVGNGQNLVDYIYVRDIVEIARSLEKSKLNNQDFILASGKPILFKEAVEKIYKSLNLKAKYINVPEFIALPSSFIAKYIFIALGMKPIVFPNRVKVMSSDYYFDISKLKKFGYVPKYDFSQGVSETVNWLIANKKL